MAACVYWLVTSRHRASLRASPRASPEASPKTTPRVSVLVKACHAFRQQENEEFDTPEGYFETSASQIMEDMGISGMALLDTQKSSGINGLSLRITLPLIAAQAWSLQFIILFYMVTSLQPRPVEPDQRLPRPIIFAAVYLHFIHTTTDLPFSVMAMRHLHHFHETTFDRALCGIVFAGDALIIPLCSMIIGSLYLCTSATVGDVILNSCAVAFVGDIDNFILAMNARMNEMAGNKVGMAFDDKLFLPCNENFVKTLNWLLCVIPLVPSICAFGLCYIGIYEMKL